MTAGRPRKPTNVLALTGATKKNPARFVDRAEEPRVDQPLQPTAPTHLAPDAQKCWLEIVSIMPPGVSYQSDTLALEQLATLLAFCRKYKWQVDMKTHAQHLRLLGVFGLTPADRSRIRVAQAAKAPEVASPDGEFAKGKRA